MPEEPTPPPIPPAAPEGATTTTTTAASTTTSPSTARSRMVALLAIPDDLMRATLAILFTFGGLGMMGFNLYFSWEQFIKGHDASALDIPQWYAVMWSGVVSFYFGSREKTGAGGVKP